MPQTIEDRYIWDRGKNIGKTKSLSPSTVFKSRAG